MAVMAVMTRSLSLHIACDRYSRYSINMAIGRLCLGNISSNTHPTQRPPVQPRSSGFLAKGILVKKHLSATPVGFRAGCKSLGHLIATKEPVDNQISCTTGIIDN